MEGAALLQLIAVLRANGVTRYRDGDFELELGAAPSPAAADFDPLPSRAIRDAEDELTEDQIAFAHVPGGPPPRAGAIPPPPDPDAEPAGEPN